MSKSSFYTILFLVVLSLVYLQGCSSAGKSAGEASGKAQAAVFYGLAQVAPTAGNKASGTVWFSEGFGRVMVEVDMKGLAPNSKHGFHIHEFGNCTAVDASSAGGHYNPAGHQHGNYVDETRHAGDLGNLVSDKSGRAQMKLTVENLSVNGAVNPILGRAVILHANPDDLVSQPTGGAGARIACGVIGAAAK